jgi:hypothetical protein
MFSAQRYLQVVTFVLTFGITGFPVYAQYSKFVGNVSHVEILSAHPWNTRHCEVEPDPDIGLPGGTNSSAQPTGNCDGSQSTRKPSISSCDQISSPGIPCGQLLEDQVGADLRKLGKPGQKIANARKRVLEILEGQNSCSEWFRLADPNPAATFRNLGYTLDMHGETYVHETRQDVSETIYRHPYVASVIQGSGPQATVTLNLNGAFFRSLGPAIEHPKDGGIFRLAGFKLMSVGPYAGDTYNAQLLTLLHEFGHVLDILPVDFNNIDGKSMKNSIEVLGHCRTEIESSVKHEKLRAR